jgi:nucleoside-diphosphate kinase
MDQATLVIIKPDGLSKSLTGNILTKLSETKLVIKPFFEEIVKYLMGEFHTKRTMALVYHGENAIKRVREICGSTNPEEAAPNTIRGSFGRITTKGVYENVIHASSDPADAQREIKLWFDPGEIVIDALYPTQEVTKTVKTRVWA